MPPFFKTQLMAYSAGLIYPRRFPAPRLIQQEFYDAPQEILAGFAQNQHVSPMLSQPAWRRS
jgi:hypothetical protein